MWRTESLTIPESHHHSLYIGCRYIKGTSNFFLHSEIPKTRGLTQLCLKVHRYVENVGQPWNGRAAYLLGRCNLDPGDLGSKPPYILLATWLHGARLQFSCLWNGYDNMLGWLWGLNETVLGILYSQKLLSVSTIPESALHIHNFADGFFGVHQFPKLSSEPLTYKASKSSLPHPRLITRAHRMS